MSTEVEDPIVVEIGDSSINKLSNALGKQLKGLGMGGGTTSTQKGGLGGLFSNLSSGLTQGLGKIGIMALGVGAISGGVKAIAGLVVSSSPMLKQMLKLFNFGIMMLLRPIGDFIGFMLRPILLMLLRTFIIPFYQTALPIAQELGDWIGNVLAPWIQRVIEFLLGLGKTIAGFAMRVVAFFTRDSKMEKQGIQWFDDGIAEMTAAIVGKEQEIVNAVNETVVMVKESGKGIENKLETKLTTLTSVMRTDLVKSLGKLEKGTWTEETSKVKDAFDKLYNTLLISKSKQLGSKLDLEKMGVASTKIFSDIQSGAITSGADARQGFKNLMSQLGGYEKMANGGIINEPIFGIGKSGKGYLLGESGAESVTPIGQSGGLTINMYGNINSMEDMNTFEKRVLNVLEAANSRRLSV